MTYRLHCFAQSGNAYKVALMLELIEEPWEAVWVDFFNGAARGPDYVALNEMAEVPTLIDGDTVLTQSGVILDYLSTRHGRFGAGSAEARREILRWILWDNHKLTANIATARFMMNFLAEEKRNADVIAFLLGRAKAAMKVLEARLEGRDWILGDAPSIADLSCAGYMFYDGEFGIGFDGFPAIDAWRGRLRALPGWVHPYELMPGHPLGGA